MTRNAAYTPPHIRYGDYTSLYFIIYHGSYFHAFINDRRAGDRSSYLLAICLSMTHSFLADTDNFEYLLSRMVTDYLHSFLAQDLKWAIFRLLRWFSFAIVAEFISRDAPIWLLSSFSFAAIRHLTLWYFDAHIFRRYFATLAIAAVTHDITLSQLTQYAMADSLAALCFHVDFAFAAASRFSHFYKISDEHGHNTTISLVLIHLLILRLTDIHFSVLRY